MARDTTAVPDATPTPGEVLDPETEELWSSRALLLVLVLLILSFWVSYYLKVRRIKSVHETIVALFAGMVVGLILRISPGVVVQNMVSFKNTIMLNVLLPPIILNSGFELRQENFFRNFGVILAFAFAGTFISAVVLGVLVYVWALLGLEGLSLTIVECLIFGSTLSATDPVTILAIFNQLRVDPKLYSIIFGESILNDAVAIVMFETLSQFHGEKIHLLSFFHGTGIFLLVFFTSMALGVTFGLGCSLLLKHSALAQYPELESCLVLLIAYTSYFFSNALTMSGIVSLLFCGITLKHYAYHNMSRRTQRAMRYMLLTLSQLAENFIFIYLGLGLFTQTRLVYKPLFILVTGLGVCVARYCAVFPISKLINLIFRARGRRADELPHSYQMMLFWAGLRGAVGVALAAGLKGDNGPALRTTVLVTVVMTMIVFGGTTGRMIEIVGIRTGVVEDEDSSDEEGAGGGYAGNGLASYHELPRGMNGKFPMRLEEPDTPGDAPYREYPMTGGNGKNGGNGGGGNGARRSPPITRRTSSQLAPGSAATAGGLPRRSFSGASIASTESDGESDRGDSPPSDAGDEAHERHVWRDGQWFNVLDERYLLPVFSNATASRRSATRKALRNKSRTALDQMVNDSLGSEGDLGGGGDASGSTAWMTTPPHSATTAKGRSAPPWRGDQPPRQPEFQAGLGSVLSSLVAGTGVGNPSSSTSGAPSSGRAASPTFVGHKRRESGAPTRSTADDSGEVLDLSAAGGRRSAMARRAGGMADSIDSASSTGSQRGGGRPNAFLVDLQDGQRSSEGRP